MRIQALQQAKQKMKDAEESAKRAKDQAEADGRRRALVAKANQMAHEALLPVVLLWAEGEADEAAVKRFSRRLELRLLCLSGDDGLSHGVPSTGWKQLMTSGLSRQEVRALAHVLAQPGVPPQAAPLIEIVQMRVASYGEPTAAELAGGQGVVLDAVAAPSTPRGGRPGKKPKRVPPGPPPGPPPGLPSAAAGPGPSGPSRQPPPPLNG